MVQLEWPADPGPKGEYSRMLYGILVGSAQAKRISGDVAKELFEKWFKPPGEEE